MADNPYNLNQDKCMICGKDKTMEGFTGLSFIYDHDYSNLILVVCSEHEKELLSHYSRAVLSALSMFFSEHHIKEMVDYVVENHKSTLRTILSIEKVAIAEKRRKEKK